MDSRGQLSAEFILLFAVVLIIISAVTIPLLSSSLTASTNVTNVADTKSAVVEIANAINIVYANGPGAKRTLDVYLPQSVTLTSVKNTTTNQTLLGVNLNGLGDPDTKYVNTTINYPDTITGLPLNLNKGSQRVIVYWNPVTYRITVSK